MSTSLFDIARILALLFDCPPLAFHILAKGSFAFGSLLSSCEHRHQGFCGEKILGDITRVGRFKSLLTYLEFSRCARSILTL